MNTHPLPATELRVMHYTSPEINDRNRRRIEQNVARYAGASDLEIEQRLRELEAEWDVERVLETSAAANVVLGVVMGALVNRRWFGFAGLVGVFLMQHALQGWCPPLPVIRHCGVRTTSEIHEEKMALRIMRGDFSKTVDPAEAVAQVRHSPFSNMFVG